MGVENNECVIATTWDKNVIEKLKLWIKSVAEEYQSLFVFVRGTCNSKETLFLAPCGSKKGWEEDKILENIRNALIKILESFNYEDGSSPIDWVEIGYGEFGQKVLRGNCENKYNDNEYGI